MMKLEIQMRTPVSSAKIPMNRIPGPGHGGDGMGSGNFEVDFLTAMEERVENDAAPVRDVAAHCTGGEVDMSRPLCPYRQAAVWDGVDDLNEGAGFICREAPVPQGRDVTCSMSGSSDIRRSSSLSFSISIQM
jgi:hypothetical protein